MRGEWKRVFGVRGFWGVLVVVLGVLFLQSTALATDTTAENFLTQVRTSQNNKAVRVVLEVDGLPAYTHTEADGRKKIIVTMPGMTNKSNFSQAAMKDQVIENIVVSADKDKLQAVISLKSDEYTAKIFTLQNPNRIVIDILKSYEEKIVEQLTPAIKYISLERVSPQERIWAHIIEVAPKSGYTLRPVLGKSAIKGLEAVSAMSERVGALAMVNGSYFHADGATIGLLKMNKEIASTLGFSRAALGIGSGTEPAVIIGQANYTGKIEFFNKRTFPISQVNTERGSDALVLYNGWYDATTKTNHHGVERTIKDGKVVAEGVSNSFIPKGAVVLSGHGVAADVLAELKIGDSVKITESLGGEWDKMEYAIGAGPMLVKNGAIHVSARQENFGGDVAGGRAPRTAVGVSDNGTIFLVVIDGRQSISQGMTLHELAAFMKELGAKDALNLDGGGPSEMVVKDKIKNRPSDGRERRVGSAVALVPV